MSMRAKTHEKQEDSDMVSLHYPHENTNFPYCINTVNFPIIFSHNQRSVQELFKDI